jgi:hypothetical protein
MGDPFRRRLLQRAPGDHLDHAQAVVLAGPGVAGGLGGRPGRPGRLGQQRGGGFLADQQPLGVERPPRDVPGGADHDARGAAAAALQLQAGGHIDHRQIEGRPGELAERPAVGPLGSAQADLQQQLGRLQHLLGMLGEEFVGGNRPVSAGADQVEGGVHRQEGHRGIRPAEQLHGVAAHRGGVPDRAGPYRTGRLHQHAVPQAGQARVLGQLLDPDVAADHPLGAELLDGRVTQAGQIDQGVDLRVPGEGGAGSPGQQ